MQKGNMCSVQEKKMRPHSINRSPCSRSVSLTRRVNHPSLWWKTQLIFCFSLRRNSKKCQLLELHSDTRTRPSVAMRKIYLIRKSWILWTSVRRNTNWITAQLLVESEQTSFHSRKDWTFVTTSKHLQGQVRVEYCWPSPSEHWCHSLRKNKSECSCKHHFTEAEM